MPKNHRRLDIYAYHKRKTEKLLDNKNKNKLNKESLTSTNQIFDKQINISQINIQNYQFYHINSFYPMAKQNSFLQIIEQQNMQNYNKIGQNLTKQKVKYCRENDSCCFIF